MVDKKGRIENPSAEQLKDYGFKWRDGEWVRGEEVWTGGAIVPAPKKLKEETK